MNDLEHSEQLKGSYRPAGVHPVRGGQRKSTLSEGGRGGAPSQRGAEEEHPVRGWQSRSASLPQKMRRPSPIRGFDDQKERKGFFTALLDTGNFLLCLRDMNTSL